MTPLRALTFLLTLLLLTAAARPAPAATPGGVSNTTIKLPQGHAGVKGLGESFEPNPFTGTASYQVGIELPPGPIAPGVALVYQGGKGRGEAGQNWHLPVLNIYRMTDKGLPAFKESDRFAVTGGELNDELVRVNFVEHYYRLKNDDGKALFVRDPANDTWTVRLPDGTQIFLGNSPESRQRNWRGTYRWFIAEKRTISNRRLVYEYWRHSGGNHLYLSRIRYGFRWNATQGQESENDHLNEVLFDYEERKDFGSILSDRYTDYTYGDREAISYRLQQIVVRHNAAQVGWSVFKTYKLNYRAEEMLSLLTSIEATGEHGEPMPTLRFDYPKYGFHAGYVFRMYNPPPTEGLEYGRSVFEDVNGDALPDLLVGDAGQYVYYENIDGYRWSEPTELIHSPWRDLGTGDVQLMDMDGDGFRDVVYEDTGALQYHPGGCIHRGILVGCRRAAQDLARR